MLCWVDALCAMILTMSVFHTVIIQLYLRGHVRVPGTVSTTLIVPLDFLVYLALDSSKGMISEIECFHRYQNEASEPQMFP